MPTEQQILCKIKKIDDNFFNKRYHGKESCTRSTRILDRPLHRAINGGLKPNARRSDARRTHGDGDDGYRRLRIPLCRMIRNSTKSDPHRPSASSRRRSQPSSPTSFGVGVVWSSNRWRTLTRSSMTAFREGQTRIRTRGHPPTFRPLDHPLRRRQLHSCRSLDEFRAPRTQTSRLVCARARRS